MRCRQFNSSAGLKVHATTLLNLKTLTATKKKKKSDKPPKSEPVGNATSLFFCCVVSME